MSNKDTEKNLDKPVVIFGNTSSASLAWYCLSNDSDYEIAAFTVDEEYIDGTELHGLQVVPFENISQHYPPKGYRMLIPVGYQSINALRRTKYEEAKSLGYEFISYVSSKASIWPNNTIGENTLIYEGAIIQPFAKIGSNCIIRSGAHISHHCIIEDHSFVAAEVAMGGEVVVGEQSFLGVGSVIRDRIRIAPKTFVGAGSVIIRDTDKNAVYVGNPGLKLEGKLAEAL